MELCILPGGFNNKSPAEAIRIEVLQWQSRTENSTSRGQRSNIYRLYIYFVVVFYHYYMFYILSYYCNNYIFSLFISSQKISVDIFAQIVSFSETHFFFL